MCSPGYQFGLAQGLSADHAQEDIVIYAPEMALHRHPIVDHSRRDLATTRDHREAGFAVHRLTRDQCARLVPADEWLDVARGYEPLPEPAHLDQRWQQPVA